MTNEDLIGMGVLGSDGEVLGSVERVLVDLEGGRLGFLIIAAAGPESRKVPVPWLAVRLAPGGGLALTVDSTRFRSAPFELKDEDIGVGDIGGAIHQYFGVSPYWEEAPGKEPRPPTAPRGLRVVK